MVTIVNLRIDRTMKKTIRTTQGVKALLTTVKIMIVVAIMPSILGCATPVTFYDSVGKEATENYIGNKEIHRIHIDAFGNIYPNNTSLSRFGKPLESHSLYDQFLINKDKCPSFTNAESESITDHCLAVSSVTHSPYDDQGLPIDEWKQAQARLWKKYANEIHKVAEVSSDNRLVFLIHGFNNTFSQAESNFSKIENRLRSIDKSDNLIFVEIYWDGFEGPPLSGAWSKAQASGPLVGFSLRQLFRHLDDLYSIDDKHLPETMFITHSSGVFVATSLLGNPYSALPELYNEDTKTSPGYEFFRDNRARNHPDYPIPKFSKVRLGMIAAATPSNSFTGAPKVDKGVDGGILTENTELIFTLNYKDVALQKYLGLANWNALGSTSSGANSKLYCRYLKTVKGVNSKAFDFSDSGFLIWNSHSVEDYLARQNADGFLAAILGGATENQYLCN